MPYESSLLEFISPSESVGPRRAYIMEQKRGHKVQPNVLYIWNCGGYVFYTPNVYRLAC